MLKLTDLRKTTRKAGERRVVYPHLLRDRSLAPRIELSIRYLESMVGRPRRDLEPEVVLRLFGDHKIARCVVACLAASYHHRPRAFAEELSPDQVAALAARDLTGPSVLRLWLYRRANAAPGQGFVGGAERAAFLRAAGADLGLTIDQLERLIALDHPANALLVRLGPIPTADDVIARFNAATVTALLANAKSVHLSLSTLQGGARLRRGASTTSRRARSNARVGATATQAACDVGADLAVASGRPSLDTIRTLCKQADVAADLSRDTITLHGRQDALDGWSRHGARLARLLAALLAVGLPAQSGEAFIATPTGDEWVFRLTDETLAMLGDAAQDAGPDIDATTLLAAWECADAFAADVAALRRTGALDGWSLRRAQEPLVTAAGGAIMLFSCLRGDERAYIAPPPATVTGAQRLAALATRVPLLILDPTSKVVEATPNARTSDEKVAGVIVDAESDTVGERGAQASTNTMVVTTAPDPLAPVAATVIAPPTLRYRGHRDRAALAALPTLLAQVTAGVARRADVSQWAAVFAEARASGALTEARLAERLGCAEDDIPSRLADPQTQAARIAQGLQYVEGFGLCAVETLERAQTAAQDVASKWQAEAQGGALMTRMLSRRLREITGASVGIECLIAYLNAA